MPWFSNCLIVLIVQMLRNESFHYIQCYNKLDVANPNLLVRHTLDHHFCTLYSNNLLEEDFSLDIC
jgi:hypothetical protein